MRDGNGERQRSQVGELFAAVTAGEPNLERLNAAIPAMQREARRRRAELAATAPWLSTGRVWLPRLAALTALVVIASLLTPAHSDDRTAAASRSELAHWLAGDGATNKQNSTLLQVLID